MYIIIEGLDRCGKDTQIRKLQTYFAQKNEFTHILHYLNIKDIDNCKEYSEKYYYDMFELMYNYFQRGCKYSHIILNRSHLGEYVYAPLYRGYDASFIFDIEKFYVNEYFFEDLYAICFIDTNIDALMKREDGNSLGQNVYAKQDEINRFIDVMYKSNIFVNNKSIIDINGKSIDDVYNIVLSRLNLIK